MGQHPLSEWLDAGDHRPEHGVEDGPSPAPRRRWRVVALAALPWAVLGGVLVGAGGTSAGQADEAGDVEDARPDEPGSDPSDPDAATLPGEAALAEVTAHRSDPPVEVAAAGAVAVREHINASAATDRRYADLVLPEGGESTGSTWVVRVVAVVLEGDEEAWRDSSLQRFAVPVDGHGRILDTPWRLGRTDDADSMSSGDHDGDGGPEADPSPTTWQPADPDDVAADVPPVPDDQAGARPDAEGAPPGAPGVDGAQGPALVDAITATLRAAGYDVAELALSRSEEHPGVVRAAFEHEGERRTAWLSTASDVRLLGGDDPP